LLRSCESSESFRGVAPGAWSETRFGCGGDDRSIFYGICEILSFMKQDSVRTTLDIPAPLYRKLKEQAAARGHSVRELVLAGVKSVLLEGHRPRRKRVKFPLIISEGPKVDLTNEQIYERVEFP
jgi:hypothetical protein